MKIIVVAGARPNFIKIASIMREIKNHPEIEAILVHTGQHYDDKMSKIFFEDLEISRPDINLEVGSASHAAQTADIMRRFDPIVMKEMPDIVIVVGDVNSTIACALTAKKLGVRVAHVEAGLRSFDREMPEEINRVLTDAISDYLFVTEESAEKNLIREGISREKIFFVGNVMIDTLLQHRNKAKGSSILSRLGLSDKVSYAILTLHRPSNVDDINVFHGLAKTLMEISKQIPIIFPCHPRTQKRIKDYGLYKYFHYVSHSNSIVNSKGICIVEPLGYIDFIKLMTHSKMVLTDSGGIQEETTILRIPCLTLRENTERPVTVLQGTNMIVGTDSVKIREGSFKILNGNYKIPTFPKLWDGKAAHRIISILSSKAQN